MKEHPKIRDDALWRGSVTIVAPMRNAHDVRLVRLPARMKRPVDEREDGGIIVWQDDDDEDDEW